MIIVTIIRRRPRRRPRNIIGLKEERHPSTTQKKRKITNQRTNKGKETTKEKAHIDKTKKEETLVPLFFLFDLSARVS